MKSEKSFRKAVIGGFNRRDVAEYLSQMSRERREECEALKAGADRLRAERDAAITARNALEDRLAQYSITSAEWETATAEHQAGRKELATAQEQNAELTQDLAGWKFQAESLARELSEIGLTKARLAEMEAESARRAAETESEAASRAEKITAEAEARAQASRDELYGLVSELRQKCGLVKSDAQAAALTVVLELDKMRDWFAKFTDRFTEIDEKLAGLESDPRPQVRAFVPEMFEEARD